MIGAFLRSDKLGSPRLVLILKGLPCSYGRCVFCPFVLEQGNLREVLEVNDKLIAEAVELVKKHGVKRVSIFNGGSFFELPVDTVIKLSNLTHGRVVDIESIPAFITAESIEHIYRLLRPKLLVVRVGFEVFDENIRFKLGKVFPNTEVYRISELAKKLRSRGLNVQFISYVLFGISLIPEQEVIRSVTEFNKLLDGVIAIKYHKYLMHHPEEIEVSERLARYLESNTIYVDWGEDGEWIIAGLKPQVRGEKR